MTTDVRALVAIPWRHQPSRMVAHEATVARYRELLPGVEIVEVDTGHEPFCLAGCRNRGVRLAEERGADVVVLGDADTLPEREPLLAAIEGAATSGLVHLPYTAYHSLRADGTAQYRRGVPLDRCNHLVVPAATSGVYVTSPETWWACGGQDERFLGWAPEDVAWLICHRTLLGSEPVRHEGRVYALHHQSATKTGPAYEQAVALYQRYMDAAGDETAMRALISERAATLGVD
ncbi:glycosyltransferase family 2 protein [Nonomuraea sp. CA-218870]|uniref:glycosyltransferase family 2 protein n=1 Tax=Nonomuraea sp. CA-218870 TaxID=3239998 RepID=UPI003D8D436D